MGTKNQYIAYYSTNNTATYGHHGPYTNKKKARKTIRAICKGNTFKGNHGNWWIRDSQGNIVMEGRI